MVTDTGQTESGGWNDPVSGSVVRGMDGGVDRAVRRADRGAVAWEATGVGDGNDRLFTPAVGVLPAVLPQRPWLVGGTGGDCQVRKEARG